MQNPIDVWRMWSGRSVPSLTHPDVWQFLPDVERKVGAIAYPSRRMAILTKTDQGEAYYEKTCMQYIFWIRLSTTLNHLVQCSVKPIRICRN